MGRGILAGIVLCLFLPAGRAEVVRLKNGNSFRGKIVKESRREVVILTKYGRIAFSRDQVARIERDRARSAPLESRGTPVSPADKGVIPWPSPEEERGASRAGKSRGKETSPGRRNEPFEPEGDWTCPFVYRGRKDPEAMRLLGKLSRKEWEALVDLKKLGPRAAPAIPRLLGLLGWKRTIALKDRNPVFLYSINHSAFQAPCQVHFLPKVAALVLSDMGEASIPPLLLVLGDANPLRRKWALAALGWNGAAKKRRDVPPRIAALLDDPDSGVREEAIRALGFLGVRSLRNRIAGFLLDPNEGIRSRSVEALKRLVRGPELDPLPLLKALRSRTEWKRRAAREALLRLKGRFRICGKVEEDLARAEALRSASSLSPRERVTRLRKKVREGGAAARMALSRALRDSSENVRRTAVSLLSRVDYPGKRKILERALRDSSRRVRMEAAGCLSRIGGMEAFPLLFRAYSDGRIGDMILGLVRSQGRKDPSRIVGELARRARGGPGKDRKAAACLLGFVKAPGARDLLGRLAGWDRDPAVRKAALESLVRLGKRESLPFLVKALKDRNPSNRAFALKRLQWISRKKWGPSPARWEKWLRER